MTSMPRFVPANAEEFPPIRIVTRLLAEMQTAIVAAGVRALDGGLERFAIFTLIVRQTMPDLGGDSGANLGRTISVYSLASSMSQPYETVRRHVNALVELGLCVRLEGGVAATPDGLQLPQFAALMIETHDRFVRLIEDMAALDLPMPNPRAGVDYDLRAGVQVAVDMMLAAADTNRGTHEDIVELSLFSTILCGNLARMAKDRTLALRYRDQRELVPDELLDAMRISVLARVIGLPDTTVRRRVGTMVAEGKLIRKGSGVVISQAWMNDEECMATSLGSYRNTRRLLERMATTGFPFHAPTSAYVLGRPADAVFA
jgi:hypothetical protein